MEVSPICDLSQSTKGTILWSKLDFQKLFVRKKIKKNSHIVLFIIWVTSLSLFTNKNTTHTHKMHELPVNSKSWITIVKVKSVYSLFTFHNDTFFFLNLFLSVSVLVFFYILPVCVWIVLCSKNFRSYKILTLWVCPSTTFNSNKNL